MRIVDAWMNADMPEWGDAPWMHAVAERYLGSGQAGLRRLEASELLEAMDASGVERAILDLNLDRVCFDFPDLTVVMAHGADPWWDLAIRLMIKWPRLHLMTSAYRPRYLPESLLHYMRTRGPDKVMFASDHPLLEVEKCVGDLKGLELPEPVLEGYVARNAERIFFSASRRSKCHSHDPEGRRA